jgi:hypothetical protein
MGEYEVGFIDDLLYIQTLVDFFFVIVDATLLSTNSMICGLDDPLHIQTLVDFFFVIVDANPLSTNSMICGRCLPERAAVQ